MPDNFHIQQKYRLFCKAIFLILFYKQPSLLLNGEVIWQASYRMSSMIEITVEWSSHLHNSSKIRVMMKIQSIIASSSRMEQWLLTLLEEQLLTISEFRGSIPVIIKFSMY